MQHFEFEHPWAFLLLLLIICIYKCPLSIKKLIFPHTHLFTNRTQWFNQEKLLYSIVLTLIVTAIASPISYDAKSADQRKGRDLIFVLDTSGSMGESGYSQDDKQQSKFNILKDLIGEFVSKRYDDNVGVTLFGTYAFSSVPLTYDMKALTFLLEYLEVGLAGENTAIGDGLSIAIDTLTKAEAQNKVIVLITDGYQNSGSIKIKDAVAKAKKLKIKIYTIGVGDSSSYDAKLLQKIAQDTDAKMFGAKDAQALQEVYNELDSLEPSAIRSEHYFNKHLLFSYPLTVAILLLLYLLTKRVHI